MCQLLCFQLYATKEDTNHCERNQYGNDDIKSIMYGVNMLCHDWRRNSDMSIPCDGISEKVLLEDIDLSGRMKEGEKIGERTFARLLYLTSACLVKRDMI